MFYEFPFKKKQNRLRSNEILGGRPSTSIIGQINYSPRS